MEEKSLVFCSEGNEGDVGCQNEKVKMNGISRKNYDKFKMK